ncbi:MAG: methylisocitrate lyase [Vampirovibrio sp.]|jgi:methylisocitrate lyase|nr:methylisocitrate lyase [Vampirovibrio sp.]
MAEALLKPESNKPARLRELLARGTVAMPGGFNAISAKIIENVGFSAMYISGAGIANGVGGYPDIGFMTATEMAAQAGYIARSVNIPAIADADNGYGEAVNVFRTVQEYERQGLSGLHIEDQVIPKRCGHLDGKQVISTENMREKIAAAVSARQNPDFLIIARVDSKAVYGFDEAVKRANAYMDAGADMIFPEALTTREEFAEFARQVKAPLLANMTEFGKTPYISVQEFESFGYNLVIFPMTAFRIMMRAVEDGMRILKETGTQTGLLDRMTSREDLYRLIHYQEYERLDATLATQFSAQPPAH